MLDIYIYIISYLEPESQPGTGDCQSFSQVRIWFVIQLKPCHSNKCIFQVSVIIIDTWYPKVNHFLLVVSVGVDSKSLHKEWLFHHLHPLKNGCSEFQVFIKLQRPNQNSPKQMLRHVAMNLILSHPKSTHKKAQIARQGANTTTATG